MSEKRQPDIPIEEKPPPGGFFTPVGRHLTAEDAREDYSESRFVTAGSLEGRMVVMVWTPRGEVRHIISMRKANEREQSRYAHRLG